MTTEKISIDQIAQAIHDLGKLLAEYDAQFEDENGSLDIHLAFLRIHYTTYRRKHNG